MGLVRNIKHDQFPKQRNLRKKVNCCFHYDTENTIDGEFVRDDIGSPYIAIIKLSDGRYVLATECQYNFK